MGSYPGAPWCSSSTDADRNHIKGKEITCSESCRVVDCPIGFYQLHPSNSCYRVNQNSKSQTQLINPWPILTNVDKKMWLLKNSLMENWAPTKRFEQFLRFVTALFWTLARGPYTTLPGLEQHHTTQQTGFLLNLLNKRSNFMRNCSKI